jgi:dTDP-4-amino-4,6-dideoxygalactose transaminase
MFASYHSSEVNLPVTDWLTERVISLPIHTEMEEDQLQYITSTVLNFVNK